MVEYWKKAVAATAIGQFSDPLDLGLRSTAVAFLTTEWGIGAGDIAFASLIATPATAVFPLIGGPLIDYLGRKKVWVLANFLAAVFAFLGSIARSWVELSVYMGLSSATTIWSYASAITFLREEVPPRWRVRAVTVGMAIVGLFSSSLFSSLLALSETIPWITWRFMFAYVGIVNLIATVAGLLLLREPPEWVERKRLKEEGKTAKEERVSFRALFSWELKHYWLAIWVAVIFGVAWFSTIAGAYSTWYSLTALKFTRAVIGVIGTISPYIIIITRLAVAHFADKYGKLKTILTCAIIGVIASQIYWRLIYIFPPGPYLELIVAAFIFSTLMGFAGVIVESPAQVFVADTIPANVRGTATAFIHFPNKVLSSLVWVPLVGYLVEATGNTTETVALTLLAVGLAGIIVILACMKKGLERPVEKGGGP
jgi:MFS family permease